MIKNILVAGFLTLILSVVVVEASPSAIDIVRASNAYSKAKNHYNSGKMQSALKSLVTARENLKGRTNRDLEFIEIMTLYKLKKFELAYQKLVNYFENPPWKGKSQTFRSIKTLQDDDVDYDAELTVVFSDLENWAQLQQSIDPADIGAQVAKQFSEITKKAIKDFVFNMRLPSGSDSYKQEMGGGPNSHIRYDIRASGKLDRKYKLRRISSQLFKLELKVRWITIIKETPSSDIRSEYPARSQKVNGNQYIILDLQVNINPNSVFISSKSIQGLKDGVKSAIDWSPKVAERIYKKLPERLKLYKQLSLNEKQKLAYKTDVEQFKSSFIKSFLAEL